MSKQTIAGATLVVCLVSQTLTGSCAACLCAWMSDSASPARIAFPYSMSPVPEEAPRKGCCEARAVGSQPHFSLRSELSSAAKNPSESDISFPNDTANLWIDLPVRHARVCPDLFELQTLLL